MGVTDDVLCNHDMFGNHKGETHQTQSLAPTFPGQVYEITPLGRLELLECVFEDQSDPNAQGWERLTGMLTPVYTGARPDQNYHGWLDLSHLGRAKFTDGTLVAFEPHSASSVKLNSPSYEGVQQEQESATADVSSCTRPEERTARMEIVLLGARQPEPEPIP